MKRAYEVFDIEPSKNLETKYPRFSAWKKEPLSPFRLFGSTQTLSNMDNNIMPALASPGSDAIRACKFSFSDAESIPLKPLSKSTAAARTFSDSHCYVKSDALPSPATLTHDRLSATEIRSERISNPFLGSSLYAWLEKPMKNSRPILGDLYQLSKDTWIVSPLRPGLKPFLARMEAHGAIAPKVAAPVRRVFSARQANEREVERDAQEFLEYSRLAYCHATRDSGSSHAAMPLRRDEAGHREAHKFLETAFVEDIRKKIQAVLNFQVNETASDHYQKLKDQESRIDRELDERIKKSKPPAFERFPSLPDAWIAKVNEAVASSDSSQVVYEAFNIPLTVRDLQSLQPRQWLNDEVINFYFQLIQARSSACPSYPRLYVFNSFFYTALSSSGYGRVKRWTRSVDIFDFDLILFPIHLGMHWVLGHIDVKNKRLCYYDSLYGSPRRFFTLIKQYLAAESIDKRQKPFDATGWLDMAPKNIPGQSNGFDCGVFACQYAECLSRAGSFDFNQSHMPYFRKRLQVELSQGKLL